MNRRIRAIGAVLWATLAGVLITDAQLRGDSDSVAREAMPFIQGGDFDSARKLLLDGVHLFPNSADLWNLLGIAETEVHYPQLARTAFLRGLQLQPDST